MAAEKHPWYALNEPEGIPSPALLVYPQRIARNIAEMVRVAGDPLRLRPHIKTHKTAEIVQMQMEAGIRKFKCATLAEADLLGRCGAPDVLLAYQPVGPNQDRFLNLQKAYPQTRFAALADHPAVVDALHRKAKQAGAVIRLFVDLNVGMNRTGIAPGPEAEALYKQIAGLEGLEACGLHAYDGHIRHTDPAARQAACDEAFAPVAALRQRLEADGYPVPVIIAGGSPTFPMHAGREGVELSPGTTLLWDARYGSLFADMDFLPAAVLLTRVISHPGPGTYCLDLGHKAIAPEMEFPRVALMGLETCVQTGQSEEHLVLQAIEDPGLEPGQPVYGIPMHVCPTVPKYRWLLTVENGIVTGRWEVAARDYTFQ